MLLFLHCDFFLKSANSVNSVNVLLLFSGCSQDVCRIFPGCSQEDPMGLVSLVEFDDHFICKYGL